MVPVAESTQPTRRETAGMAGVFRHIPAQLSVEPVALLPAAMAAPLPLMAGLDTAVAVVLDTQAVLVAMAPMARFPVVAAAAAARQ